MQGEVSHPQETCPDDAVPSKNVAAETPPVHAKTANRETMDREHAADIAMSDVVLAEVSTVPAVTNETSPKKAPPPADSKLPATLSNASWKRRQNLPLTIIVPPTPWADSPVYEHAIALKVAPESWRTRLFGRRNEPRSRYLPCWLISLGLHLAVMVLLGSLAAPFVRQFATDDFQLLVSSTHESDSQTILVTFETSPRTNLQTSNSLSPYQNKKRFLAEHPFADPAEKAIVKATEIQLVDLHSNPPPNQETPASRPATSNLANQAAAAADPSAVVTRRTPDFGNALTPLNAEPVPNRPASERHMDEIVERFMKVDFGKRPGEAGEKARREFEDLGPEAIPSLVRGLNKAAQMSASDPVLVISHKLDRSLESNTDPTALKYVIDNLGRDVPEAAKHIKVITTLKAKWVIRDPLVLEADAQTLADILIANGIPPTERVRKRMAELSKASPDTLARALLGKDKDDPVAATAILLQRRSGLAEHQKPRLLRGLIRQLKNDGTRLATTKALALLVEYANYKPRELPAVNFGERTTLDGPATKLVETSQRMELFAGPLPPYRRYRPLVVEFLEATDANRSDTTAAK